MKHFSLKALAVVATMMSAGSASAVTLNIDSGWDRFGFGAVGTSASPTFTFTLTGYGLLSIVDGFLSGDRFEVFVNSVSQGLTSLPVQGTTTVGQNYDAAIADSNYSNWSRRLGPGSYLVSLMVKQRSGTDTRIHLGGIRLDTAPVPVPAAGLMLLTALGMGAFVKRRQAVL